MEMLASAQGCAAATRLHRHERARLRAVCTGTRAIRRSVGSFALGGGWVIVLRLWVSFRVDGMAIICRRRWRIVQRAPGGVRLPGRRGRRARGARPSECDRVRPTPATRSWRSAPGRCWCL